MKSDAPDLFTIALSPTCVLYIIYGSTYQETTREQLHWLINRTRHPFNLQQLEKGNLKGTEMSGIDLRKEKDRLS